MKAKDVAAMKAKDIVAPAVIGALITIIILINLEMYLRIAMNTGTSASEHLVLLMAGMAGFAFTVGGFITAFLSAREAKNTLDKAMASSVVSSIITMIFIGGVALADMFLNEMNALDTITFTVLFATMGIVAITASALGGFVLSLINGKGSSKIDAALKRAWKSYDKNWFSVFPPLLFSIVSVLIMLAGTSLPAMGENETIAANAVLALLGLVLTSFTIAAVTLNIKKRMNAETLFRSSLAHGIDALKAMIAVIVPALAVIGILVGASLASVEIAELIVLFVPVITIVALAYFVAVAFAPIEAIVSKTTPFKAMKNSFEFVRKEVFLVLGMLGLLLLLTAIVNVVFFGVNFVTFMVGLDSSTLTEFIASVVNILLMNIGMAAFYLEVKE